jgi:alpha-galactosidase
MENRWHLATDDTRITIEVRHGQILVSRLESREAPGNWLPRPFAVPLMAKAWVGQREYGTAWKFDKGASRKRASELVLGFTNASPRLALRSIWRARPGYGPVEHWIEIENPSRDRVTLSHQDSLSLRGLRPAGRAELRWIRRGGGNASEQGGAFGEPLTANLNLVLTSNCEDGSSPVPWMAFQVGARRGLYVGWEFSGIGRIHARAGENGATLDLDIGNNPDFKTDIEPGETLLVPAAFVGCYPGDVDEGCYRLHRFVLEKLRPAVPKDCPDPTLAYNLYLDAGGPNAKEADVLRSAGFCHDLGFETFMPDAMWFPATGDWRWDPARFPRGAKPIQEYVHDHGMRMALWCAWSNGGASAAQGALSVRGPQGHPDWFNSDYAPDWQPGPFYGAQLCLACPAATEWAIKKTQWLVSHHKLDYLKHDCGPIVNGCNKRDHRHHYGVDVSYWATMGYYQVQESLRHAFPNIILENCSGGGHIKDFGIVQRTHYTVTTDTLSNLADRQSIYDSTFALPPLVLQAYTYERYYNVPGDDPGPFLWRSAMMGAWQIDPTNTLKWSDEERESARRAAHIYKTWIRPMLADVKVHHILPRPDGTHWDGMFYWSPRLKRGTLYIFRPHAKDDRLTVKLKGLEAQRKYRVWCEDGSVAPGVRRGAQMMREGLEVALPRTYTSDLIYIQDLSLGERKAF